GGHRRDDGSGHREPPPETGCRQRRLTAARSQRPVSRSGRFEVAESAIAVSGRMSTIWSDVTIDPAVSTPGSESRKIGADSSDDMSTAYRAGSPRTTIMPVTTKFIGPLLLGGGEHLSGKLVDGQSSDAA